jgi:hypothetical protein
VSSAIRVARYLSISAAAAVLAAAAFFPLGPCLALRAADGRALAFLALDRRAPRFEIAYRHSVARLPAVEYFRASNRELELYKTAYQGLGAGLPFTDEGGSTRLENGWILIEGLRRRFPSVTLSPMPLTEHCLLSGGRALRLRIERRSLAGRLVLGRWMEYIKP